MALHWGIGSHRSSLHLKCWDAMDHFIFNHLHTFSRFNFFSPLPKKLYFVYVPGSRVVLQKHHTFGKHFSYFFWVANLILSRVTQHTCIYYDLRFHKLGQQYALTFLENCGYDFSIEKSLFELFGLFVECLHTHWFYCSLFFEYIYWSQVSSPVTIRCKNVSPSISKYSWMLFLN